MTTPTIRYLEDFEIGQKFSSTEFIVTEADIIAFATRYDPQPFHTNPVTARDTVFHGLAASGWHTAAITMRLLVDSDLKPAGGLIGAGVEILEWPRPVRPGDSLRVEVEVVSVRESRTKPTQGMVVVEAHTRNQRGESVQIFRPKLVVLKRPTGAP